MIDKNLVISQTNKRISLLRCFEECVDSFVNNKPLPLAMFYQNNLSMFKFDDSILTSSADTNVYLFDSPVDSLVEYQTILNNFEYLNSDHVIDRNIIECIASNNCIYVNHIGKWILITSLVKRSNANGNADTMLKVKFCPPLWLLAKRFSANDQQAKIFEINQSSKRDWITYLEETYSLKKSSVNSRKSANMPLMYLLNETQPGWSLEMDEELVDVLKAHVNMDEPGSIRNLIKSISVSTQRTTEDVDNLINLDPKSFWESDSYSSSYNGYNSIRIFLKPDIKINQLYVVVKNSNRQYMPKEITVYGGSSPDDELTELNKLSLKSYENGDVLILKNCSKYYQFIDIRIKSCQKNGSNCRIYGIKIFDKNRNDEPFPVDIFSNNSSIQRHPRLFNFNLTYLVRRAELLLRFIKLFDLIIDALLPVWINGTLQKIVKSVKKLLVLSTKRVILLETILDSIPTVPCYMPVIYIDRPLAFAYRGKTSLDPKYQNTIFMQIYNNINSKTTFRWEKSVDQWWECKFIGEGIIDQGGGFRDSLSDISEELCPNNSKITELPLPFFIRSPNQYGHDSNTFRDTYIPNPSCEYFDEYEFIGKLMGACLRSKEKLALYLSPFFWKKLSGESISWKHDFATVDAAEVRLIESIEKMDKEEFENKFKNEKTWSCILSDGTFKLLKESGSQIPILYEDRIKYCEEVKSVRLSESDRQIEAIRKGFQSVLTDHIFTFLTWSELELKICGASLISIDDLKMSIEYEDELSLKDNKVKFFWEAMANFTNEERSKFVRFVTGRKRLPVKIYFCSSDQNPSSFPDSSTCNCSIYFPNYPNAETAEDKLRYAIMNCVAIDTDCTSYDD